MIFLSKDKLNYLWIKLKAKLSAVAFSGKYSDLSGTPESLPADGGNADTVGGLSVHTGVNNEANKIMRTDSNGYANFSWMQTTSGQLGGKPAGVWVKSGNWLYYQTTDDFILNCGIATKAEVGDMATALSIISGVDK